MRETIKKDGLIFKIGSLEWLNHFGLPLSFLFLSLMFTYFLISDFNDHRAREMITWVLLILPIGIITYWIQLNRLRYNTFKINIEGQQFRKLLIDELTKENWRIDLNNKIFLQAYNSSSLINSDVLIVRYDTKEIKWTAIHSPYSHNSFMSLLSPNTDGKIIMNRLSNNA